MFLNFFGLVHTENHPNSAPGGEISGRLCGQVFSYNNSVIFAILLLKTYHFRKKKKTLNQPPRRAQFCLVSSFPFAHSLLHSRLHLRSRGHQEPKASSSLSRVNSSSRSLAPSWELFGIEPTRASPTCDARGFPRPWPARADLLLGFFPSCLEPTSAKSSDPGC